VGFPQARYLAALAPASPEPEETVNSAIWRDLLA
jgi:hypothetical protein